MLILYQRRTAVSAPAHEVGAVAALLIMNEFTFCKIANEHFIDYLKSKEKSSDKISEETCLNIEEQETDMTDEYDRKLSIVGTIVQGVFGFIAVGIMCCLLVLFALVV